MFSSAARRPILAALAGIALLSIMDASVKALVARLPVPEVAFLRYSVGSIVMLTVVSVVRPGWPRPDTIRANGIRAVLVVITALSFFYGLSVLPLADALIITFISPVITAVLAAILLHERVGGKVAGALAAGFVGVLVLVLGTKGFGGGESRPVSLLGVAAVLLSAFTYAATNVLLRARAQRDHVLIIVLMQNLVPMAILAGPAAALWVTPDAAEWRLLGFVGCLGVGGHLCLARAYAGAEATRLAPLEYTALLWAAAIGFVVFGEVPTIWSAVGACLILAGAVSATRRRRVAP